jgi:hypothetical protein
MSQRRSAEILGSLVSLSQLNQSILLTVKNKGETDHVQWSRVVLEMVGIRVEVDIVIPSRP